VTLAAAGSVINRGVIAGGNGSSAYVELSSGNVSMSSDGGDVASAGVRGGRARVFNAGVITGGDSTGYGSAGAGVRATGGAWRGEQAEIFNTGSIRGGNGSGGSGVLGFWRVRLVNAAGATIEGGLFGGAGVVMNGISQVRNAGAILGGASYIDAQSADGWDGGIGLAMRGGGRVLNTGLIQGADGGINLHGGASGVGGTGLEAIGGDSAANAITVDNTGVISGGNGARDASGVYLSHGGAGLTLDGDGVVVNGGTLAGGLGQGGRASAVAFGDGTHTLALLPGSNIVGDVRAGAAGNDTLSLRSGVQAGTLMLDQYQGFAVLWQDAGNWRATGEGSLATLAAIDGGVLTLDGTLHVPTLRDPRAGRHARAHRRADARSRQHVPGVGECRRAQHVHQCWRQRHA
jgi:hypothetical protein